MRTKKTTELFEKKFAGFKTFVAADDDQMDLYEFKLTDEGSRRLSWLLENQEKLKELINATPK